MKKTGKLKSPNIKLLDVKIKKNIYDHRVWFLKCDIKSPRNKRKK